MMRTHKILTAFLLFVALFAKAQNTVTITVTGLKSSKGNLMLEMVDANNKVVAQKIEGISEKKSTVLIKNVKPGQYAIRFFHDENSNGKMDTGTFGIPTEGYGFSNDARGFMGPPDLEDQLFEVKGDVKMTLKTKN